MIARTDGGPRSMRERQSRRCGGGPLLPCLSSPLLFFACACSWRIQKERKLLLQARTDGLALECENTEHALVNTPERFSLHESFEAFDPQRELPKGKRSLTRQPPLPQPLEMLGQGVLRPVNDPQILVYCLTFSLTISASAPSWICWSGESAQVLVHERTDAGGVGRWQGMAILLGDDRKGRDEAVHP